MTTTPTCTCTNAHCIGTFCGESASEEGAVDVVDEATEGEGLGAESGDCGGVARQLVPVGGCGGWNEYRRVRVGPL